MPRRKLRPSNLNSCNPPPALPFRRYRAAGLARWVGQIIATSADEAIEAAAIKFRTDAKKLSPCRATRSREGDPG
jgi:hypothetical protein